MDIPWIIDLDDHEASGIRDFTRYHANGEREEVMSPRSVQHHGHHHVQNAHRSHPGGSLQNES